MGRELSFVGAAAILTAMLSAGPTAAAQMTAQRMGVSSQVQQQVKQPSQEFQGTIEKAGTKYVLDDKASGAKYELDNQDKAKEFLDEDVKVTGTLDPNTNAIEVSEIQELK